jgi:2'-hydroxyisoflavone reductase
VTLFNRGQTNPGLFPEIPTIRGNRENDLAFLQNHIWDSIIDTSGFLPQTVKKSAEFLSSRARHYVFISSISVYRDLHVPGINEDSPTIPLPHPDTADPAQDYGALKAACEEVIKTVFPGRVLMIRPGLIIGPGDTTDRLAYWLARFRAGHAVLAPGDGSDPVQFIDVRDLAEFVIHALEEQIIGTTNVVGPGTPFTMKELLDTGRTITGSNAPWQWIKESFLLEKGCSPWSDLPLWIPASSEYRGFLQISSARARALGLSFRPLAHTISDSFSWWESLPPERRAKPRAGLSLDREQQIIEQWRASQLPQPD